MMVIRNFASFRNKTGKMAETGSTVNGKSRGRESLFYEMKEVAGFIGVTTRTLRDHIRSRKKTLPPFRRVGRAYKFPKQKFHEWMEGK